MTGTQLIDAERQRQIEQEGWTLQHDDAHRFGEIASAAMCYALAASFQSRRQEIPVSAILQRWPWELSWWKPSDDPIHNLVKAGALLAAEIDRLQRGAALGGVEPPRVTPQLQELIEQFLDAGDAYFVHSEVHEKRDIPIAAAFLDARNALVVALGGVESASARISSEDAATIPAREAPPLRQIVDEHLSELETELGRITKIGDWSFPKPTLRHRLFGWQPASTHSCCGCATFGAHGGRL